MVSLERQVRYAEKASSTPVNDTLKGYRRPVNEAGNNQNDHTRITEFNYDTLGRLISQVSIGEDGGRLGQYTQYDELGNITQQTSGDKDAGNLRGTETEYDVLGRAETVLDIYLVGGSRRNLNNESFEYDLHGNRVRYTNKRGATWEYGYDTQNRLIWEQSPIVATKAGDDTSSDATEDKRYRDLLRVRCQRQPDQADRRTDFARRRSINE